MITTLPQNSTHSKFRPADSMTLTTSLSSSSAWDSHCREILLWLFLSCFTVFLIELRLSVHSLKFFFNFWHLKTFVPKSKYSCICTRVAKFFEKPVGPPSKRSLFKSLIYNMAYKVTQVTKKLTRVIGFCHRSTWNYSGPGNLDAVLSYHRRHILTFASVLWQLLVGRQEGHPACKKAGCWFVVGDDLTGALHVV